jgi:hypothetical protein
MTNVNYGYDYLFKSDEELSRSGIEYNAVVLPGASCGITVDYGGLTREEYLQELYDMISDL